MHGTALNESPPCCWGLRARRLSPGTATVGPCRHKAAGRWLAPAHTPHCSCHRERNGQGELRGAMAYCQRGKRGERTPLEHMQPTAPSFSLRHTHHHHAINRHPARHTQTHYPRSAYSGKRGSLFQSRFADTHPALVLKGDSQPVCWSRLSQKSTTNNKPNQTNRVQVLWLRPAAAAAVNTTRYALQFVP